MSHLITKETPQAKNQLIWVHQAIKNGLAKQDIIAVSQNRQSANGPTKHKKNSPSYRLMRKWWWVSCHAYNIRELAGNCWYWPARLRKLHVDSLGINLVLNGLEYGKKENNQPSSRPGHLEENLKTAHQSVLHRNNRWECFLEYVVQHLKQIWKISHPNLHLNLIR